MENKGYKIKIFLHLLAWAIILGLPLFIVKQWKVGSDFLWFYYVSNIISGVIFYINYLFLVPKFLFQKKKVTYYLSVFITLFIFYFVSTGSGELVFRKITRENGEMGLRRGNDTEQTINPDKSANDGRRRQGPPPVGMFFRIPFRQMHFINYVFTSLSLVFFSVGLRTLERQSKIEKWQKELEKEKLNSELAFLKNQISPHFFFNTLNNIYSLISINAEDSKEAVLKLSKMMRYLLYESENGNTKLSNEIDFMNNYIDLMKLRMNEKVSLTVDFPGKYNDISIPPLLFIPFIENAFKHGISYREKSYISITMTAMDDSLNFRCVNSVVAIGQHDGNHSGIGLDNAEKRLNLLFPNSHELTINRSSSEFEVLLNISLS